MKALLQYAPMDNRLEDVPLPEINDDEMLLQVKACGICAGDVKAYHGGIRIWGTSEKDRYIEAPVIGGHEFYGTIAKKGKNVKGFDVGTLVTVEQIAPCNHCRFCREGKYWMCEESAVYGFKQKIHGGFAEYVKIHPNSIVHRIPEGFSLEQAVLIEPIACGMHAVELAQIKHDDIVVVSGLGAIGSSIVNLAKLCLPKKVIGLDIKDFRLDYGLEFGADFVINPMVEDLKKKIDEITDGHGADVYIEASGSQKSVEQGLEVLSNHGRFIQMGVFASPVTVDWNVIGDGKELTIQGSHLSAKTFDSVIEGIKNGWIRTEGLVTHKFSLDDWKKGFDTAASSPDAMKVVLIP